MFFTLMKLLVVALVLFTDQSIQIYVMRRHHHMWWLMWWYCDRDISGCLKMGTRGLRPRDYLSCVGMGARGLCPRNYLSYAGCGFAAASI